VSFRYSKELPWVLKDIRFKVEAGEKLGIIGRTGSGKSSLLQALFYLYPIEKGNISVGNCSPLISSELKEQGNMDLEIYRQQMSFISQDPTLFRGTLHDNLDIQRKIGIDLIFKVLNQVGLQHLSNKEMLEMSIDERGRNLSLGERQLICMARCLLQNTPVVVMDEATSSVDPSSEELMVKATEQFFNEKTQIIVAHRLSTILNCNRLLWLENGSIKMLGPTKEVLRKFELSAQTDNTN
jgi:ABC-type multidrug transport system fused ATPase/permease subunit